MANFKNYPIKAFSTDQKFLADDPNQVVRVTGQSMLDANIEAMKKSGKVVNSIDTLTEAIAGDYLSGIYLLVGGGVVTLDGDQAIYRVSDAGSGGIVMANGNELVLLFVANTPANIITPIDSVANIAGFTGSSDDQQISLKGWHPDSDVGGGTLYWDSAALKSTHNGGTIFSPTVPWTTTTADYLNAVGETDGAGTGVWVRVDKGYVESDDFGTVGDGTTDDQPSISAACTAFGGIGGQINFRAAIYRLASVLTIHEGVRLNGLGTVGSAGTLKGVKFLCDHAGDGVVFDGNNGSSNVRGNEIQIGNIWILKAPNQNGGTALSFISTNPTNTPGFITCNNVHVVGNSVSSGEGLWSKGWVFDGRQASIGMKDGHLINCGVTGVSTDNKYLDIINLSEVAFDDFFIRDASASYPSFGSGGMTIDSTQVGSDPASSNPSTGIRFSNSRILGDVILGEVNDLYFSNCTAVNLTPSGVPGAGTSVSWAGGSLINKYIDLDGYTVNVSAISQSSKSDLSNQFRVTANTTLSKSYSGIFLTHENATANLTHTLPNFTSTNIYDFTIINNSSSYSITVNKNAANTFAPAGTVVNSNITSISIPTGSSARFTSTGITGSSVDISVPKGLISLNGVGTMSERGDVVRDSTLSTNLLVRPKEATHFVLDAGASSRNFSVAIATFNIGDEVAVVNNGAVNNINFDALVDASYSVVITPGNCGKFIFNGATFSQT